MDLGQSSEEGLVCLVICLFHHMVVEIPLPGSDKEPAEQSLSVEPPKVKLGIHFCRPPASASPEISFFEPHRICIYVLSGFKTWVTWLPGATGGFWRVSGACGWGTDLGRALWRPLLC